MLKVAIIIKDEQLAAALKAHLLETGIGAEVLEPGIVSNLERLYAQDVIAGVVDAKLPALPLGACQDIFNNVGRRIPLIVIDQEDGASSGSILNHGHFSDQVTLLRKPTAHDVIATLEAGGLIGDTKRERWNRTLPFYNPQVAVKMLRENRGLCVLTIDASNLSKIEVEYGTDAYLRVKQVFQNLLFEMWGMPGCFRVDDVLCRRSYHGNVYYVLLNRSRDSGTLPRPGILEKISDRINRRILNSLWSEIFTSRKERRLPSCVNQLPMVGVGYASAMYNPCLDEGEVVQTILDSSARTAKVQLDRIHNLLRELMHTLIDSDNLLYPNFQGIFKLQAMTKQKVDQATTLKSIKPFAQDLFGFESLIRVRVGAVEGSVSEEDAMVDPKFLRPDVLFSMAKSTNVALELDQACIRHAARNSNKLPGWLMVNILPRNLYFFDRLRHFFSARHDIIFEVSESEAISNFELMVEIRARLKEERIGIAADDFGKGFAGLERIINIKPDIIKFDRSLIENIHADPIKQAYVKGLVKSAKLLNATVLAEGVELWEEAEVLKGMNIDLVQGFLFHRPQALEYILNQLDIKEEDAVAQVTPLNKVA